MRVTVNTVVGILFRDLIIIIIIIIMFLKG